jgi:serine protease Do
MNIDAAKVKEYKLKEERGVLVTMLVPGGPAEKAGVRSGDVVLEFDGQRVENGEQLPHLVMECAIGHVAKLGIWRNGAMQTINVTVEARPREASIAMIIPHGTWGVDAPDFGPTAPPAMMSIPQIVTIMENPILGVDCEPLGDEQQFAEFFGVKDGLLVKKVTSGSPAARAGIKAGDVIVKVEETRVGTTRELNAALRPASQKPTYQVTVVRNKKEMPISVSSDGWRGSMGWPGRMKDGN